MVRYRIVIGIDKCIERYECFLSCRDEFWGNECKGYSD